MKDTNQLIISNPNVMMGKPVVAGTRITVELILDKLAAGDTYEQILDAHPRLTLEGIQAAASLLQRERCARMFCIQSLKQRDEIPGR